jgi:hypothetical protein
MRHTLYLILGIFVLVSVSGVAHAEARAKMASEAYEPFDPKKKKPGEECKTSDECQRHHSCSKEKDSEKNVCVAPPPRKLPPGVVT